MNARKKDLMKKRKNRKKEGPSALASAVELAASRPSPFHPRANSWEATKKKTWKLGTSGL